MNQYANDEEERLMKALAAHGEHLVALAELDLEVGMRLCELLNATWGHVDAANKLVSVPHTKNDKPRVVPLTKRVLEILRRLRQDTPDDERIFDSVRTGRRRRQLMVCFEKAVKEAGVSDFHFHDLRHTFATRPGCKSFLPAGVFPRDKNGWKGLSYRCRNCKNRQRRWRTTPPK